MIILGVDPGLAHIGAALVHVAAQSRRSQIVEIGHTKTEPAQPLDVRMRELYRFLRLAASWAHAGSGPEAIAFEDQASAQIGQLRDPKRANARVLHVREVVGIIRTVGYMNRLDVVQVSPQRAKNAVCGAGAGSADKSQIRAGIKNLAGFDRYRWNEHTTDAVAIAIAGARKLQHQRIGIKP